VFAVRVSPGGLTAAPDAPAASDNAPATPNTVTAFVRPFCFEFRLPRDMTEASHFTPHLRVHHTPRTAATQRSNVRHLRRSHPIVRFGSLADILEGLCDVRFTPDSRHRLARRQRQLCAKSGPMRFGTAASVSQQLNKGATTWVAGYFYGCSAFPFRSFLSFGRSAACTVKRHIKMHSNRVGRSNSARAFKCAKCGWSARHTPSADQRDRYIV
jgi:hypothetical protein